MLSEYSNTSVLVQAHVVLGCTMGSHPITFLRLWPATDQNHIVDNCPLTKFEGTESTTTKRMMMQLHGRNLQRLQHSRTTTTTTTTV